MSLSQGRWPGVLSFFRVKWVLGIWKKGTDKNLWTQNGQGVENCLLWTKDNSWRKRGKAFLTGQAWTLKGLECGDEVEKISIQSDFWRDSSVMLETSARLGLWLGHGLHPCKSLCLAVKLFVAFMMNVGTWVGARRSWRSGTQGWALKRDSPKFSGSKSSLKGWQQEPWDSSYNLFQWPLETPCPCHQSNITFNHMTFLLLSMQEVSRMTTLGGCISCCWHRSWGMWTNVPYLSINFSSETSQSPRNWVRP